MPSGYQYRGLPVIGWGLVLPAEVLDSRGERRGQPGRSL